MSMKKVTATKVSGEGMFLTGKAKKLGATAALTKVNITKATNTAVGSTKW